MSTSGRQASYFSFDSDLLRSWQTEQIEIIKIYWFVSMYVLGQLDCGKYILYQAQMNLIFSITEVKEEKFKMKRFFFIHDTL